ncbi:ZIP family metal transporter [Paenibacillus sp. SYP-B3998]|uniref:ZIP family metal transporter n=1 Tax=Paenibacillus sp. SYP-B3998 TaxID=2678564 RepID=A0A6G3ZVR5_9BACL|nr:ZIP family metal transporter [Paenibacillus sp. SYP-B3998]NEW05794.1 ZIP family metal transporter [Paenibacillus sp. SYP-B3998]
MSLSNQTKSNTSTNRLRAILWGILPLVLLVAIIATIAKVGTGVENESAAPIEVLHVEKITLNDDGIQLKVLNSGPEEVTIAQVTVDDAFWNAEFLPSDTLKRFEQGTVKIPYPWVQGDPHEIKLITSKGLIFTGEVAAATATPEPSVKLFWQYALIGFYVGVVPIGLGLMWYPFLRRFSTKGMHAMLALTVGLLFFLVIDTFEEGFEMASEAPGIFQGTGLVWIGALLSCLFLIAVDQSNERKMNRLVLEGRRVSYKIATGIGLHNFGEGLAIGSAFAGGEAALGTFLIIGFTLHNITEGVGIAAPLLKDRSTWKTFVSLAAIAGGPAILGTWVGGFIFNDTLAALFFGIGAGAILQVIYVISKMILKESEKKGLSPVSWLNFGGLAVGILLMYVTALMVKF